MFEVLSSILKYVFTTIIYIFIYSIIRLIYLDIKYMNGQKAIRKGNYPYLKLINRRDRLNFKVEESYILHEDMTVGRSRKNDIVILDPYISGHHARFTVNSGGCFVEDLGSTNGTTVNGQRIGKKAVRLKDGDKIHMGQLDFLFVNNVG